MKTKRITHQLIASVAKGVEDGLTGRESSFLNDISDASYDEILKVAQRGGGKTDLTLYETQCCEFMQAVRSAKLRRKQRLIRKLQHTARNRSYGTP